jgi:mono/diheme cytochrome c family protein
MKKLLLSALALSALAACRGQTSHETPIFGIRNMYDQPKYDVQEESDFFPDHRTMRPLVDGVISSEEEVNPEIARGRVEDDSAYVMTIPPQVIAKLGGPQAMVERGKARFGIYCVPCHDATGSGEGLAKRRAVASGAAAFAPPTFHQDRLRHAPDGQIFATITNGKSNMPPYAMQIRVEDRWAIVSYVRALQVAGPKMAAPAIAPTAIPGATNAPAPGGTAPTLSGVPLTPTAPGSNSAAPPTSSGASRQTPAPHASASAAPASSQEKKP